MANSASILQVIYNDSVVLKTFEQLIYINSYQGLLQDFLVGEDSSVQKCTQTRGVWGHANLENL